MSWVLTDINSSVVEKKDEKWREKKNTHIVDNHANMACASLFIGFTGLMIKLG